MINNFIQQQNCYEYKITAKRAESTLEPLNIENSEKECETVIPSLFYPILVHSENKKGGQRIINEDIDIYIPMIDSKIIAYKYFMNDINFLNDFNLFFVKYNSENNCYFGLSMGCPKDSSGLNENEVLLSWLKQNNKINNRIFSFDKFILNENTLNSVFYFGEVHNHFNPNDGIIGTCNLNEEDNFWGCSFNEMNINNKTIQLTNTEDNGKLYKIYLTTESYDITFPRNLITENDIHTLLEDKCTYDKANEYFECNNFFNGKDYIPLKLISQDLNITLELDKFNRYYSNNNNDNKEIIKINFSDKGNYMIFPLIMFKQFHVQFNAEKKEINFYTNDTSLLQVKQEKKETPKNEDEGSSSSLTIFLVILIILLIIGIGFGIFYFLRLKRSRVEKDINRFTKFEDEEDFKNMNENKVY